MFINYAHRGASSYAPENTMLSFCLGIIQGADGIETDIRKTKDGELVLSHDATLERETGYAGLISDYTLLQLQNMSVISSNGLKDHFLSFEDFLRAFAWRDLTFAFEIKESGIEQNVIDKIYQYKIEQKVFVTSSDFMSLKTVKQIAPKIRIGYLVRNPDETMLSDIIKIGGEQICPYLSNCTKEFLECAHDRGIEVRAWGVRDVAEMKYAYDNGFDGATLDFPDELVKYKAELSENGKEGDMCNVFFSK